MSEKEKREAFLAEVEALGEKKAEHNPPLYRLLWKFGINVAPPLYASGKEVLIVDVVFAGGFWGTSMWLLTWRDSPGSALIGGLIFGLFLGLSTTIRMEAKRKKLGITGMWSYYKPTTILKAEQG
ncbi:MAG: DUF6404 family protein [Verrucomicrobiota bacterium]